MDSFALRQDESPHLNLPPQGEEAEPPPLDAEHLPRLGAGSDPVDKSDLIRRIESARSGWDELLGQVDDELAMRPGAEGELSAKDLVAHVTWYEREVEKMLRTRAMDVSGLWALGPDERNAAIHDGTRGMSLEDVRA